MDKSKTSDEIELSEDDEEEKNWKGVVIALLVIIAIGGLVGLAIFIVSLKNAGAGVGEPFTLDDLLSDKFKVKVVRGGWSGDTFVYRCSKSGDITQLNPLNNHSFVLFPDNMMKSLKKEHFHISADLRFMLVSSPVEMQMNGQRTAKYDLYSVRSGSRPTSIPFPGGKVEDWAGKNLSHVSWSSYENSLIFVYNNNLFYQSTPYTSPTILTDVNQGDDNDLVVAMPDLIYSEEILKEPVGYWLSPDLKTLAYLKVNQSRVPRHYIPNFHDPSDIYPTPKFVHYPKAGDTREGHNPTVQLMRAETQNHKLTHTHLHPPSILANQDHYITLVKWLDHRRLLVVWANRQQTMCVFSVCESTSNDCKTNFVEIQHQNTGWVFVNDVIVIKEGNYTLLLSPQLVGKSSSFTHIVLLSTSTKTEVHKQYLTYGMFDVTQIVAFSHDTNELFYIATNGDPRSRHLFKLKLPNDLDKISKPFNQILHYTSYSSSSSSSPSSSSSSSSSSPIYCLTCSTSCAYVTASFSASSRYYLETCLGPHVPRSVIKSIGNEIKNGENGGSNNGSENNNDGENEAKEPIVQTEIMIEDNNKLRKLVARKALPDKHHFTFKAEDGTELLGQFFTPPLSSKDSYYQFPLLIYVDNTPGSQTVTEKFKLDFTTFMTSSEGVVVASVDGRGSGGKGVKSLYQVYKDLGGIDLEDLLHGIEHMKLHENINKNRVAMWGQAYGGFLVSHVMGQKGNHSINCGIAISPITDFKIHNTAYTERFMGIPTGNDNYRGYDNANVIRKVKNFRDKQFLLAHGMADEKIHFQHSANLANSLSSEKVLFHQVFYPTSGHNLLKTPSTSFHLYASMIEFLRYECWSDKAPETRLKPPKKINRGLN